MLQVFDSKVSQPHSRRLSLSSARFAFAGAVWRFGDYSGAAKRWTATGEAGRLVEHQCASPGPEDKPGRGTRRAVGLGVARVLEKVGGRKGDLVLQREGPQLEPGIC